jgi:hypothetical protein
MNTRMTTTGSSVLLGEAPDASPSQRPGVPKELDPPRPATFAHWAEPERQPDPGYVLKRKDLTELTPVFGTTVPPRGLSGVLRRAAYAIPEHRTSHWLVLMLADRVDVLEHRALRILPFALPLAAGGAIAALAFSSRRRSRRWF